jgi:hypothetical protein
MSLLKYISGREELIMARKRAKLGRFNFSRQLRRGLRRVEDPLVVNWLKAIVERGDWAYSHGLPADDFSFHIGVNLGEDRTKRRREISVRVHYDPDALPPADFLAFAELMLAMAKRKLGKCPIPDA